jgi:hypothetical protein
LRDSSSERGRSDLHQLRLGHPLGVDVERVKADRGDLLSVFILVDLDLLLVDWRVQLGLLDLVGRHAGQCCTGPRGIFRRVVTRSSGTLRDPIPLSIVHRRAYMYYGTVLRGDPGYCSGPERI